MIKDEWLRRLLLFGVVSTDGVTTSVGLWHREPFGGCVQSMGVFAIVTTFVFDNDSFYIFF